MSEESTTPDLVELSRRAFECASRHEVDALVAFYVPDAVLDLSDVGLGTFEGIAAIRSMFQEWWGTWAEHVIEAERIVDLGDGVVFSPVREDGRLLGSDGHVEHRRGFVFLWARGRIERQRSTTTSTMPSQPPNGWPRNGG
jgi:ketosteroid isomerase-like protein